MRLPQAASRWFVGEGAHETDSIVSASFLAGMVGPLGIRRNLAIREPGVL